MAQTSRDLLRVLQGGRIILAQMAQRQGPALNVHLQNILKHSTELVQSLTALGCELAEEYHPTCGRRPAPPSSASPKVSPVGTPPTVDPLGWSKVHNTTDLAADISAQQKVLRERAVPSTQVRICPNSK